MAKRTKRPRIGSIYPYWFNEKAIVMTVRKYTGVYTHIFAWIVGITDRDGKIIEIAI